MPSSWIVSWTVATGSGGADAVNRPAGCDPGVVGGACAVFRAVTDDARIAAHVAGARSVLEQVRIVLFLPDEDQMRGGHELSDERAAGCGAGERIGSYAPPAVTVAIFAVEPELLFLDVGLLQEHLSAFHRGTG